MFRKASSSVGGFADHVFDFIGTASFVALDDFLSRVGTDVSLQNATSAVGAAEIASPPSYGGLKLFLSAAPPRYISPAQMPLMVFILGLMSMVFML